MKTNLIIRSILLGTCAVAGLSFNVAATAQDWKSYTAHGCQPANQTIPFSRSAVGTPALANPGTSAATFYCPVVRDTAAGGPGRVKEVAVRLYNGHKTLGATCVFNSRDIDGVLVDSVSKVAPPNGFSTLRMGPVNTNMWGSYELYCQIPGRDPANGNRQSYLINYRVDEQ